MEFKQHKHISSGNSSQRPFFQKERNPIFSGEPRATFFNTTSIQPKLAVNQPTDSYEKEADSKVDKVVQRVSNPDSSAINATPIFNISNSAKQYSSASQDEKLQKEDKKEESGLPTGKLQRMPIFETNAEPADSEINIRRKCTACEREEQLQTKSDNSSSKAAPVHVVSSLSSSKGRGNPLPAATLTEMGSSFSADFSTVRIYNDDSAVKMNRDLNAQAFTHGSDIYFNSGKYDPETRNGKHLLAHELTHVLQQSNGLQGNLVQRDGFGDVRLFEACEQIITEVQATPTYKALAPDDKKLADEIISEVNKKSQSDRYQILLKLKLLFDTPEKSEADITLETNVSTVVAVKVEKARITKPKAAKNTNLEEKASKDKKRKWTGIKGKFGGGTYYVDNTSSTDIVVRAKIFLTPTGTGTVDNVNAIKKMEDGIEKAASTKGYLVDIQFVNDASDPDTFKVEVNPGKWEVATNWSGGDPVGFAHELHHMFAFKLDRYNYIELHSDNDSMTIPKRLHWFREELKKPAGYNDPTSIMNSASHPNDSDVCTVAGLDPATCLAERKKLTKP